jgi:predicted amidophosphoribosyltransferase
VRKIPGRWRDGYALDIHTLSSIPIGYNEYGHLQFDTKRSELGELLYRLKYSADKTVVSEIVDAAETFVKSWVPDVEVIVPVPPSSVRSVQPVLVLAEELSRRLAIPLVVCVRRTRESPQLKNVYDLDERLRLLKGLHEVDASATRGKKILLFDDLYRSGATMDEITALLYDQGEAADVFALTITRTRSHQ